MSDFQLSKQTNPNKILIAKQIDANTTDLEAQIDKMVYQLYNLTAEEIATIEGNTQ